MKAEHTLNLNDQTEVWSEVRTNVVLQGVRGPQTLRIYIAHCSCGFRMEGRSIHDIAALFARHVEEAPR